MGSTSGFLVLQVCDAVAVQLDDGVDDFIIFLLVELVLVLVLLLPLLEPHLALPPGQEIKGLFPDHVGRGRSLAVVAVDAEIE